LKACRPNRRSLTHDSAPETAVKPLPGAGRLTCRSGSCGVGHLLTSGNQPAVQGQLATITLVAAQQGSHARGTARVDKTDTGLAIQLTVEGLEPPPAGHFYTCWLVADDDTLQHQDRVAVGSFTVPGTGSATMRWDTAATLARYPHLGVTLEPNNGIALHQGPKVLVAAA
jgi:anti-sigma-K factor RskA